MRDDFARREQLCELNRVVVIADSGLFLCNADGQMVRSKPMVVEILTATRSSSRRDERPMGFGPKAVQSWGWGWDYWEPGVAGRVGLEAGRRTGSPNPD